MFLAIDIGNTNITFGVFDGDIIKKTFRFSSNVEASSEFYENSLKNAFAEEGITDIGIISVVNGLDEKIKHACDVVFKTDSKILDYTLFNKMRILTQNPNKTGIDRLINAYAILDCIKLPAVVIDIGTAVTFDVLSSKGDFIGGAIMPGVNIQLSALHSSTSKLPEVAISEPLKSVGDSTENAVLSGVVYGIAGAVDRIIEKIRNELGEEVSLAATGGQKDLILKYTKTEFNYVESNLTLNGIKKLYDECRKTIKNF